MSYFGAMSQIQVQVGMAACSRNVGVVGSSMFAGTSSVTFVRSVRYVLVFLRHHHVFQ